MIHINDPFTCIPENSHLYSNPCLLLIQRYALIGIRQNSFTKIVFWLLTGFLKAQTSIWTYLKCYLRWDNLLDFKCLKSFSDY